MNSLKLTPNIGELYKLNDFINNIISKEDFQVELIIEEIFANIVNYSNANFIIVNVEYIDTCLMIEFIDDGIKFNPLLKEDPKMPKSVEEAKVGGWGIHITKELSDEIFYEYFNGENHLKIIKKVE